jgi:hypothetical protein
MKYLASLFILLLLMLIAACQPAEPACPADSIAYLTDISSSQNVTSHGIPKIETQLVEIKGRDIEVDRVIRGTLCNDSWSGTVYVPCEIQILEWEENPNFLENCELKIEPGTVVYVAAHNDEPYYQGCSCHTGEGGD